MTVKRNLVANFTGSAWVALMSLAFVPVYIKFMGIESYGVVGVFTSVVAMLAVLDLGLSQAMTREMARLSSQVNQGQLMADTARTLEVVYWIIAVLVLLLIILAANWIAFNWLNPETLSLSSLRQALWIMALVVALRWPIAIYNGGLNGLQRQVDVNILLAVFATLQGVGAIVVLWKIEPTIRAFFLWQAVVALIQVVVSRHVLWRSFAPHEKGNFSKAVFRNIWQFAAGMTGISVVSIILMQLDKILLSRMLSLADFGYYAFAAAVAMVVYRIIGPVFTAYYPRLTELVARKDQAGLEQTFHQGCQLMAVTILPLMLVLAFFATDLLTVWTQNPDVVLHASFLVSLLVIGNTMNGLMHIPYALQLSHGWTKLALYLNIAAVILLGPAIYFATQRWGAIGAAGVWILLNSGYLVIGIQLMFRRFLITHKWQWYINDVFRILLPALLVTSLAYWLFNDRLGSFASILMIAATWIATTLAAFFSATKLNKNWSRVVS